MLLLISGCGQKQTIDLDLILKSKIKTFSYVQYRPPKMDYTYCDKSSDIVDVILENNRLIVVCLAVDNTYLIAREKSRFFKYSQINSFGKVNFCGWRDNHIKIDAKGQFLSNKPKMGSSGKCPNFNIYKYNHT